MFGRSAAEQPQAETMGLFDMVAAGAPGSGLAVEFVVGTRYIVAAIVKLETLSVVLDPGRQQTYVGFGPH